MAFGTYRERLRLTAVLCTALIAPGELPVIAQQPPAAGAPQQPAAGQPDAGAAQQPAADAPKPKSPEEVDSLVAPIALYPDPLLAQVLAASTYPLEIVEAQRWLKANPNLKGEELTKAATKQSWDASVQALVAFPQALKLLDDNIKWTTDLGNAFLDQQADVMDAVQRMRKKAKDSGKLETTKEQKVEVKTVESKTVVEIQPASPQVIYVPSYNPTVVYGPPVYAYPPIVYPPPPSTGAVIASAAVSFGVGVMMGAMWSGCCGGGGWGWGCHWGGGGNNNIVVNNNFNTRYGYNNVNNINGGNRTNIGNTNRSGNSTWQHNPTHRGAVPYGNRNTAQQYGGAARNSSGQMQRYDRAGQPRPTATQTGMNRDAANRSNAGANRGQAAQAGAQDRVGNRSVGSDSGGRQASAFSGSESRERTQAASDRGFSSTRESGGGGRSAGGGGGGGRSGGRSGGGGGRRR